MALPPGSLVYIDYGERPRVAHVRIILPDYVVLTPDFGVFVEMIDEDGNEDIAHLWHGNPNGNLPRGVPGRNVYGFAPMTAAELTRHMHRGRVEGARVRAERGLDDPAAVVAAPAVGARAAPAPGAAVVARGGHDAGGPADEFWVLAELVTGKKIGEKLTPPAGFVSDGVWGLMHVTDAEGKERPCLIRKIGEVELPDFCDQRVQLARASESVEGTERSASNDVRTLEVKFGYNGERQRGFRDTARELQMTEFEDFP